MNEAESVNDRHQRISDDSEIQEVEFNPNALVNDGSEIQIVNVIETPSHVFEEANDENSRRYNRQLDYGRYVPVWHCRGCDCSFYSQRLFYHHLRDFHNRDVMGDYFDPASFLSKKFECSVCWLKFTRKPAVKQHMARFHSDVDLHPHADCLVHAERRCRRPGHGNVLCLQLTYRHLYLNQFM